ncbi:MAG: pilus assembly protein [Coriobacteriales bacterium]|nr:pilus assembly protein [Coriobacteriales bacterium]
MRSYIKIVLFKESKGQASVEAAILLPLLFVIFGLFLQPCFLLYDKCVMQSAAVQTARLAATATFDNENLHLFAQRRLGAIPNVDVFHIGGMDSWDVKICNEETCETVTITNHVRPLPLLGIGASLLNKKDDSNNILIETKASANIYPVWLEGKSVNPQDWISQWK